MIINLLLIFYRIYFCKYILKFWIYGKQLSTYRVDLLVDKNITTPSNIIIRFIINVE